MPLAIILNENSGQIELVEAESPPKLLDKLAQVKGAPSFLATRRQAEDWLSALASPSGWYEDVSAARMAIADLKTK